MTVRKQKIKAAVLAVFTAAVLLIPVREREAAAVGPPSGIMRIGLYYGATALPAANLQNVTDYGSGYEFGYFDENRRFVSIGAWTDEVKITMMRDINMYYNESDNSYKPGEGEVQIGCFHIALDEVYYDFESARSIASQYDGGFVKYDNGMFRVCAGNYTSRQAAESVLWNYNGASITEGTSQTIAVAATGTGRIIFEFDCGGSRNLGVRPRPSNGNSTLTWFKTYKYQGDFQYSRIDNGDLTVVNFINIEDYIKGIIPYEMVASWPLEALKAQALCARTYAATKLGTHSSAGFDLCTGEHCQRYSGINSANENTNRAADETRGMYITYNGELCETYYSSSDGGATENAENVWNNAKPYLIGVIDPYEADVAAQISNYYWKVTYSPSELTARLNARGHDCSTIVSAVVQEYTSVGNAYSVVLTDANGKRITLTKGEPIRLTLGINSMRFATGGAGVSVAEKIYINSVYGLSEAVRSGGIYAVDSSGIPQEISASSLYALTGTGEPELVGVVENAVGSPNGMENGRFVFSGTGTGHNVGMSQWGAYSMAMIHGMTAEQIIKFYYTGVDITYFELS